MAQIRKIGVNKWRMWARWSSSHLAEAGEKLKMTFVPRVFVHSLFFRLATRVQAVIVRSYFGLRIMQIASKPISCGSRLQRAAPQQQKNTCHLWLLCTMVSGGAHVSLLLSSGSSSAEAWRRRQLLCCSAARNRCWFWLVSHTRPRPRAHLELWCQDLRENCLQCVAAPKSSSDEPTWLPGLRQISTSAKNCFVV